MTELEKIKKFKEAYERMPKRGDLISLPLVNGEKLSNEDTRTILKIMQEQLDWAVAHPEEDPYETRDKDWQNAYMYLIDLADKRGIILTE